MTADTDQPAASATLERAAEPPAAIQPGGFLLVLSGDWMILAASENVHRFLGESHVTLIDEPFSKFVQAQALHDLRNLFSRLGSSSTTCFAYRVRLIDDPRRFDLAFHTVDGRILLEGVASADEGVGQAIGSVSSLAGGLAEGAALLDDGARRMRALTGFDRATLTIGGDSAESTRGAFSGKGPPAQRPQSPRIVTDVDGEPVPLFPRKARHPALDQAILRSPPGAECEALRGDGIAATLSVPIERGGEVIGWFHCDHRQPRACDFETLAAAGLFAQMFAMQLEIDRLGRS